MERQGEPLWKLQATFLDELQRRSNIAKYEDITLKELIELGFNNNYLNKKGDYSYKKELGWVNENGYLEYEFNENQLNAKVKLDYYDYEDGYMVAFVVLVNEEDYKLFEEV